MHTSYQSEPASKGPGEIVTANRWGLYVGTQIMLVVAAGWAYWPTLVGIVEAWLSNPDYSHGLLVVPLALAFLWVRRDACPKAARTISWSGLSLLAAAAAMRFCAARLYLPNLDGWSVPIWLAGLIWIFHGRDRLRWMLPSLAFLWFATPLPGTFEILLSTPLQHLAALLSGWTLRLIGQPAVAEGTTILLSEHVLDIERACSGLRMFYGILAMAFSCVVLLRMRGWPAIAMLIATVPIALFANVCRIVATGLLLQAFSSEAASKFSHDFAGFLMIPLAIGLFVLFARWLQASVERLASEAPGRGASWLLAWAVLFLVGVVGLIGWGQYQQQNMLVVLKGAAARYEGEENWALAGAYLQRYLQIDAGDDEVFERYAELQLKSATGRRSRLRALSLMRTAWQRNRTRIDMAEQVALTAYDLDKYSETLSISEELLAADIGRDKREQIKLLYANAMNRLLKQQSASAKYSWEDLANALEEVHQTGEAKVSHSVDLARLWQVKLLKPDQATRAQKALDILNELVSKQPSNPMAWLARHQHLLEYGLPEGVDEQLNSVRNDIDRALELAESASDLDQTAIFSAAAQQAKNEGDLALAKGLLSRAIATSPQQARPYILLAELKRADGTPVARREAISVLNSGLSKIGNSETSLLLPLASLQVDVRDWQAADQTVRSIEAQLDQLSERRRSKALLGLGLIRARLLWETEGPYPAIRHLESIIGKESVRVHRQLSAPLFAQANLLLGRLYDSVRILDRASEQYRLALQLDPDSRATRIEAIAPVLNSGDLESAELLCRQLLREDPDCQEALLAMIRLRVRRQIRQPLDVRDWKPAERAYEIAQDRHVSPVSLFLARVEMLEAQGSTDEAKRLLQEALDLSPDEPLLWRESALLLERSGELVLALQSARKLAELEPEEIEPQVMLATLLEKTNRSERAEAILTDFIDRSSGSRWVTAALELARLKLLLSEIEEARSLLEEIHTKDPTNLNAVSTLASVAWATGERASLAKYEAWLREIEGDRGTLWRFYRAQRLLDDSNSTEDVNFKEVSRLSQELQDLRPRWSKTNTLLGNIALRAGNSDGAIAAFRHAWNLGDRSALLADRLIELLTEQGREREAQAYVLQVRTALSLSSRLFDRVVPYFVVEDQQTALDLAEAWASRRPEDADAQLRLGRVLLAISSRDGAEEREFHERAMNVFYRALELSPNDVGVWLANLSCHRQVRGTENSDADVLAALAERVELDDQTREFVFAGVYEDFNSPLAAREHYRRAIDLVSQSGDLVRKTRVLENAAMFYAERIPSLAYDYAREAVRQDKHSVIATRVVTQLLADSENSLEFDEALALSETLPAHVEPEEVDAIRRNRARLLAKRGTQADIEEATNLLETLLRKMPNDKLLLGKLYEDNGRIGPAFEILSELCTQQAARPQDQSAFLRFWQDQFLVQVGPSDAAPFASVAVAAYSRLLELPSQQDEWLRWKVREERLRSNQELVDWSFVQDLIAKAISRNRNFADWRAPVKKAWCRSILQALLQLDLPEYALRFAEQPCQGLQNVDLSIALCHALILVGQSADHRAIVREFLDRQLDMHADRADLARAVGDYRYMSGQFQAAVDSYSRALSAEPDHMLTANNIALSLAELPNGVAQAREILSTALSKYGRDPILLDTLAMVELIDGHEEEALQLLDEVLDASPENSVALLHQAMAYQTLGKNEHMQDSFEMALVLKVNETLLSQRDRNFYRQHFSQGRLVFPTIRSSDRNKVETMESISTDDLGVAKLR